MTRAARRVTFEEETRDGETDTGRAGGPGAGRGQPGGGGRGGYAGPRGGGGYRGGYGGYRGGYGGYRGGYGGWAPFGFGLGLGYGYGYGWAPWGYYPAAPYYYAPPYVYDDYDDYEEPAPPPPPPAYYRAPPAEAQPEAPAPRVRTAKSFIVYFPFDRDALTEPAKKVVDEAARYAAAAPGAKTTIVGYTDAAGSEGYNQALSERRSQVVRETLLADGLQNPTIDMAWKGKHDLAVKTPDGVKEPYNRRVTIVVRRPQDEGYDRGGAPEDGGDGR
jgi:outer membrane protein OmpA-like peptidoglycan-associated protein